MSLRAAIYARVSTADKDQNVETQLIPLRKFVAEQGWVTIGEFIDHGIKATNMRGRGGWHAALDAASRKKIDVLLVWKLDRAFRSVLHASTTLKDLRGWGVGLRSCTEPWADTTSPQGELVYNLLNTFAQFESALISERTKAGMVRAKAEGKHVGRPRVVNGEWATMLPLLQAHAVSQREAARRLHCSAASVNRMLARGA